MTSSYSQADGPNASKTCRSCGRTFTWRKRWETNWDEVRYCSAACRTRKVSPKDRALEQLILKLLQQRDAGKTICPSEVARHHSPDDWRPLMEPVRRAARRLVDQGELEITQRGQVVDPSRAKGAIRLRKPRA